MNCRTTLRLWYYTRQYSIHAFVTKSTYHHHHDHHGHFFPANFSVSSSTYFRRKPSVWYTRHKCQTAFMLKNQQCQSTKVCKLLTPPVTWPHHFFICKEKSVASFKVALFLLTKNMHQGNRKQIDDISLPHFLFIAQSVVKVSQNALERHCGAPKILKKRSVATKCQNVTGKLDSSPFRGPKTLNIALHM